jgi:hypothetical protein
MNYLSYADKIDYFGIEAKTKFDQYKLEEIKECTDCKIIIINNSSQLNGINKFMNSRNQFLNKYIKIYLYKRSGLELVVGPLYIESSDKINNIIYYIVNFISRDSFTKQKEEIDNDINIMFNNNKQVTLFYN